MKPNGGRSAWFRLRNQLASHALVTEVRRGVSSLFEPSPAWRSHRFATMSQALASARDGYWCFSRPGRQAWDGLGVRCINAEPPDLPWWWYRDVSYPALSLIVLNNALAYREDALWPERGQPRAGDVWSAQGEAIAEVFRPHHPEPCSSQTAVPEIRSQSVRRGGTYFYLGWLSMHYGHFLLETLAHWWPLVATDLDTSGMQFTAYLIEDDIPTKRPHFLMEALERFGLSLPDISLIHGPLIFEKLVVPVPSICMGRHAYSTPAQVRVWDTIRERRGKAARALYLSRRRWRLWGQIRRPLSNEQEVEDLFRHHGYEIIYPETLGFDEQLALYGQADVLAGAVGSNMHNAAFMPPGGQVLVVAPSSFATHMDVVINGPKDITTNYFFVDVPGMTFDSQEPWTVDVEELGRCLASAPGLTNRSWDDVTFVSRGK